MLKAQLLQWAQQFDEVVWLDSNNDNLSSTNYEAILAVDAFTVLKTDTHQAFAELQEYQQNTKDWIFGELNYDLKNAVEDLVSKNHDEVEFPELYFFQPKRLFLLKDETIEIHYLKLVDDEIENNWREINTIEIIEETPLFEADIAIQERVSKSVYFYKIEEILAHIHRGDIYEVNFCHEFFVENYDLNPLETYKKLNELSHPPFAAFLKLEEHYALSASPERYIRKNGTRIISQPIKGTAKRSKNKGEDEELKTRLKNDPKERAENVMIVDLVRNDLSRTAEKGSVTVDELCGLYSFGQVHQLISTVSSQVDKNLSPVEILRTTFPMGSMTGAPKVSAMKIIEKLEDSKRGLYSGSIGYFKPNGDFDFNVVIRTILYNSQKKYTSFSVGGAITAKSSPENEYQECLVKAKAMREALQG